MNTEAAYFTETLLTHYQNARGHIPGNSNLLERESISETDFIGGEGGVLGQWKIHNVKSNILQDVTPCTAPEIHGNFIVT
jgi:hypothetical protein